MSDVAAIVSLLAALAALFAVFGFWLRLGQQITEAKVSAQNALQEAAEAKQAAAGNATSLAAAQAAHALFREQVAREYVDRDMIREIESRVVNAIEKAARASTDAIVALAKRIDGLADRGGHHLP